MKIIHFKPVSIYTHPAIYQYEFGRMMGTERLYKIVCVACFLAFFAMLTWFLCQTPKIEESRPQRKALQKAFRIPNQLTSDEVYLDTSIQPRVIDCGSKPC